MSESVISTGINNIIDLLIRHSDRIKMFRVSFESMSEEKKVYFREDTLLVGDNEDLKSAIRRKYKYYINDTDPLEVTLSNEMSVQLLQLDAISKLTLEDFHLILNQGNDDDINTRDYSKTGIQIIVKETGDKGVILWINKDGSVHVLHTVLPYVAYTYASYDKLFEIN